MILQSLHGYYERMCADPDSGMPPYGMSMEDISFALVLDAEGKLQGIDDLRELEGKKLRPRKRLVPIPEKKGNGIKPNFLWDTQAMCWVRTIKEIRNGQTIVMLLLSSTLNLIVSPPILVLHPF